MINNDNGNSGNSFGMVIYGNAVPHNTEQFWIVNLQSSSSDKVYCPFYLLLAN